MELQAYPPIRLSIVGYTDKTDNPTDTARASKKFQETYPGSSASDFQQQCGTYRDSLYLEFAPLVKRLVRQYGTTADQRQELEGEIYWQFCCHLEAFDPSRGVPLRPYIVRLLSASVYTYARKQWKLEERETALNQTASDHPVLAIDPTPQWVHNVSRQQIVAALPLSLSQLPERQRQVVIMRFYEQRSFDEIAGLLSIKAATARSLLRHGLNSLRKNISPLDFEDL